MHDYDVVIIGAGIGGLTCGALLAKHGMNVLICEQHDKPGGYCTSYKRGGFTFDVPHVISGVREGAPVRLVLHHLGVDRRMDFIPTDTFDRYVYPDVTLDCYTDIRPFEEGLARAFPQQRQRISRFLQAQERIWSSVAALFSGDETSLMASATGSDLDKCREITYSSFLGDFFDEPKIKEVLGSGWFHLGMSSSEVSALAMIMAYMSFFTGGAGYPRGGFQSLSDAVAAVLEENGGTLRLKTKVNRILVENGRTKGVELDDKEAVRAGCVVSNADTKRTFLDLLAGDLCRSEISQMQNLSLSSSGVMVQLAIRMDLPRSLDCGHLLFLPRFGASADYFALASRGLIETNSERLGFALGFPTLKDPSLAPPDHHILSIIHMPASPRVFEDHRSADRESYVAAKKSIAGSLIAATEQLIPGLSKSIVDMDVITPRTLERYTGATGGCWYDVAETPAQLTMRRRFAYPAIENLYLTGAKTVFGPALYGAILGGLDTADAILGRKLWEQVFQR